MSVLCESHLRLSLPLQLPHRLEDRPRPSLTRIADFRRIFVYNLPILYFHSLLHSLVGRQSVQRLLDQSRQEGGIHIASVKSGHGNVFVSRGAPGRSVGGGTEVWMDIETQVKVGVWSSVESESGQG